MFTHQQFRDRKLKRDVELLSVKCHSFQLCTLKSVLYCHKGTMSKVYFHQCQFKTDVGVFCPLSKLR